MRKRILSAVAAVAVLATGAFALQQAGILYPQFTPTEGTFDRPAGTLGEAPTRPWTATTVAASVDGKPVEGKLASHTGEIVDLSCYLQVGKHGDVHRDCGQKCLRAGQPIGLVTQAGEVLLLMEEEHNPRRDGLTDFRTAAIDNMAKIMTVRGTESMVSGQRALYVHGYLKQ